MVKKNREIFILIFLIFIAGFFRFYNLEKRAVFFADEERDAYVVAKTIITDHHLTLIGPSTSVGNIYLGPAWYYFLLPWYLIFRGDPIAAPVAISFIGVLTTILFYIFGKEIFNQKTGFIAALIYGSSSYLISITNRAWNPSLIPITSLIFIYSLYKLKHDHKNFWWGIVVSIGLGVQFHLTAFLYFPALIIFLLIYKLKISKKFLVLGSLFFVFLISPLIIFDLKHNFWNTKAIIIFLKNIFLGLNFGNQKIYFAPYYLSIFYPPLIFLLAFFLDNLFKQKLLKAILILTMIFFILFNFSKTFNEDTKFSLFYKKEAVKYAINKIDPEKFRLTFLDPGDLRYGFRYLFYFYKKEPEESTVDQDYQHFYKPQKRKFNKTVYFLFECGNYEKDYCDKCSIKSIQSFGAIKLCIN